jgi:hypothetical protein
MAIPTKTPLLFFLAALTMGAVLPASASGGMILVSLEEVQASFAGGISEESESRPAPPPVPGESPDPGYLPDETDQSSCGSGDISTQSNPTSAGLYAAVDVFALQPSFNRPLIYCNPALPPPHLWRLFRPPRTLFEG